MEARPRQNERGFKYRKHGSRNLECVSPPRPPHMSDARSPRHELDALMSHRSYVTSRPTVALHARTMSVYDSVLSSGL